MGPMGPPISEPFMQVIFPPGRGRRPAPLFYNVTRHLNETDIAELWNAQRENTGPKIKALRYNHHVLAKAVASGKSGIECSNLTGMSQTYISLLKNDPAFQELVSFYADEMNELYVDVHQRMATLGTSILEELTERFEADPDKFTKRELLDMFTAMADRSIPTAKGGPSPQQTITTGPNGGLALQINFVSPTGEAPKTLDLAPAPPTQAATQAPAARQGALTHDMLLELDGEPSPTSPPSYYPSQQEIFEAKGELVDQQIAQREADAAERDRLYQEHLARKREKL